MVVERVTCETEGDRRLEARADAAEGDTPPRLSQRSLNKPEKIAEWGREL
jgi:hypothetical protein